MANQLDQDWASAFGEQPQRSVFDVAALEGKDIATTGRDVFNEAGLAGRSMLGNIATTGRNTANAAKSFISPFIPNAAPQGVRNFFAPDETNYYHALGVEPNIADRFAQGGMEFAMPFAAANKGVKGAQIAEHYAPLATNALAGFIHGGAKAPEEGENRITNSIIGTGIGVGSYGAPKALSFLGQPYGKYISNRLVNPLLEKAAGKIDYKNLASWEGVQDMLRGNFKGAAKEEKQAWKENTSANKTADRAAVEWRKEWGETPSQRLDLAERLQNSQPILSSGGLKKSAVDEYSRDLIKGVAPTTGDLTNQFVPNNIITASRSALKPLLDKVRGNPNLAAIYKPSIDNLRNAVKNPPKTYQEAQNRVHDLNAAMKVAQQATGTKDLFLNTTVKDLKDALTEDIRKSSVNTLVSKPYETLQNANKATIAKQNYSSMPQMSGGTKQNKNVREFLGNENPADEGMLSHYIPEDKAKGVKRFQKLEKDLGSKEMAQQVMQRYLLGDVFKSGEADLKGLLKEYNKFSPSQQKWLFNKDQNDYLKAASKAKVIKSNHEVPGWTTEAIAHKIMGVPGAAVDLLGGSRWAARSASPQGLERALRLSKNGSFKAKGYANNFAMQPGNNEKQPSSLDADWAAAFGGQ